ALPSIGEWSHFRKSDFYTGEIIMGLFSGLMGNASEVDDDDLEKVLANTMIDGEQVEKAYKVVRDMFIFTNKRLILIDKQ
ncbi:PH domain-containing protein, partial [Streptomyces brasiliscabiei]|uniref:PH domain-containing protein n=1 Tax=Streptomyces brasiliscabiei TaxID=2736302 RepID=UPI003014C49C